MNKIANIQRVALREVWKHEARDFTTWLQNSLDCLNDIINIQLTSAEREQSAGSFNIDLLAEDENGNTVIIENQLEKSNHDHLGKLLTYLTSVNAKAAIWIVADARPEHINAINWLNESASADFYLIKIEAIKIEKSPAAPLFTLIVGPTEESKVLGSTKKSLGQRGELRKRFWTSLLHESKNHTKLFSNISPGQYGWIGTSAGKRGLSYVFVVLQHSAWVEFYIDKGADSQEINKKIFDTLFSKKSKIEKEFGEKLEWQRLDSRRASRIKYSKNKVGWKDDQSKWAALHLKMIKSMISLDRAIKPEIKSIK